MPFTLAHPAAALPLRRRLRGLGSASALAVGSMVPDLPYFLPVGIDGPESHSAAGLLWFDLPMGLACWLVYVLLVRPFAFDVLPAAVVRRVEAPDVRPDLSLRALPRIVVSVLVGAATHVAWDSFTHATGAGVDLFPILHTEVPALAGYEIYSLLQHLSSIVGLALLAWWTRQWLRRTPPRPLDRPLLPPWVRALAVAAVVLPATVTALLVFIWRALEGGVTDARRLQQAVGQALFASGTVLIVMLVLAALAYAAARRAPRAGGVDSDAGRA
jgi:hypothetical protein